MRTVPWNRLLLLVTAVFLLFSVFGFYSDLMRGGTWPYAVALVNGAFMGANAALWVIVLYRAPRILIAGLVALQFFNERIMVATSQWMTRRFALHFVPGRVGVPTVATFIVVVVMASYFFFVMYIQAEGKESYRLRTQLELAHGIQKTLVPPISMRTERFEVYGFSQPSDKVGGDLVDAVLLPNGDVIAYLADIAGHGLSAGILMGMLKTAAHTALLDAASGDPAESLPIFLEKLNRVLPDVKEPQMYATLTAFRLNADGSVWRAMAASPPVLHWSPCHRSTKAIQTDEFPLGLLPVSGFSSQAMEIASGDLLVVATDGVLEVCNRTDEEFGIERLAGTIEGAAQMPLPALADTILQKAQGFGRQVDDQTLLLIRQLA